MKKNKTIIVVLLVTATLMTLGIGGSANSPISIIVDGTQLQLSASPLLINGRVLVPLRGVFETLGAEVEWHPPYSASIAYRNDGAHLFLAVRAGLEYAYSVGNIANRNIYVDEKISLDSPAVIRQGSFFVPLRFVAESIGASVNWNSLTRTVTIMSRQK